MRISIALCSYNGEAYLQEQLASLAQQTLLPDELIICDDRSQDHTMELAVEFAETSPFPIQIHQNESTLGVAKNFEKAIRFCTGDIIFLCDQDDVWLPDKLQTIVDVFEQQADTVLVFTDAELTNAELQPLGKSLWENLRFDDALQQKIMSPAVREALLNRHFITGATMGFRANLIDKILPIPADWHHDAWIGFIASYYGKLVCLPEKLILYRQHGRNQIGATEQARFVKRSAQSLRIQRSGYAAVRDQYQELLAHLGELDIPSEQRVMIEQKIQHMNTRAQLPANPFARIKPIWQELRAGRYQRYSWNGVLSALRDLFG